MIESNIWMRCAVALIDASVSKQASKTPALLRRSKRLHTLFQGPKRSRSVRGEHFDGEEMKRLEETAIVLGLASPSRQAGAKHRVTPSAIVGSAREFQKRARPRPFRRAKLAPNSITTPSSASPPTVFSSANERQFPPQAPGSAKCLAYPCVPNPEAPPIRPERHVENSIATIRRQLTIALARTLMRCPCCQALPSRRSNPRSS